MPSPRVPLPLRGGCYLLTYLHALVPREVRLSGWELSIYLFRLQRLLRCVSDSDVHGCSARSSALAEKPQPLILLLDLFGAEALDNALAVRRRFECDSTVFRNASNLGILTLLPPPVPSPLITALAAHAVVGVHAADSGHPLGLRGLTCGDVVTGQCESAVNGLVPPAGPAAAAQISRGIFRNVLKGQPQGYLISVI